MNEGGKAGLLWLGTEKCDLLFRVAGIGAKEGRRVLVIDNSLCGDFFSAVAGADPGLDDVNRGNLTALRDYKYEEAMLGAFDHVFYYQGMNRRARASGRFDILVVQSTALGHEIRAARDEAAEAPRAPRTVLVYRDRASKKVSPPALAEELSVEPDETITMDYDRGDMSQYVSLTLDGDFGRLRDAGEDMREAVAWFAGELYGMGAKDLKRYR